MKYSKKIVLSTGAKRNGEIYNRFIDYVPDENRDR